MIKMLQKKNRQTFRGLSHEEKVRKLQKLTRVPLQNLKTNIAQSDLEQDDISVPICLKLSSNANDLSQREHPNRCERKSKLFDQQQINRTIRTMTKELYTLQLGQQKSPIHASKRHQRTVSIFSIQGLHLESPAKQDKALASKQALEQFYSSSKNHHSTENLSLNQLAEISAKLDNTQNKCVANKQSRQGKKQIHQRHTEPLISNQQNEPNKNLFPPKLDLAKNKDDTQSQMSKRFSRSKRGSEQLIQLKNQKKLKFNRSSQKNRNQNRANNKENDGNIYTNKKTLLTERLSFDTIPTYETLQNDFKKRKTIGKSFITFQNENMIKEVSFRGIRGEGKALMSESIKNSLRNALLEYEQISKNQAFKKLQEERIDEVFEKDSGKDFLLQLYTRYRSSIEVLKSLQ